MVSTATVLSLNWIHSKIISGATFHIIGLTKIPKIEFLPLDWIYRSIRIITVRYLCKPWISTFPSFCYIPIAITREMPGVKPAVKIIRFLKQ